MLYGRLLVITFLLFAENAAGQINTAIKWDSAAYYFRKSDFQNSLRCLDDLIALQPAHADAYIWKADIYGQLKNHEKRIEALTLYLALKPGDVGAYLLRGMAFLNMKQYDSAIADMTRVIGKYRAEDSTAYFVRAVAYQESGSYEKARTDFDSAAHYQSNNVDYLMARAQNKMMLGDIKGMVVDLTAVLRMRPGLILARRVRAGGYFDLKEYGKSVDDCTTGLATQHDDAALLFIRAQNYMQLKKYDLAVADLDVCSRQKTTQPEVFLLRGMANYYLARDEQAIADLTKALDFFPDNANIYSMRGVCKNNLRAGQGCADLATAARLGQPDGERLLKDECGGK